MKFSWRFLNHGSDRQGVLLDGQFFPALGRKIRRDETAPAPLSSFRGLVHLRQFASLRSSGDKQWHLTASEVERFERGLHQRGVLPSRRSDQLTVFHAALQEVNICRWRARRSGIASDDWNFAIDLPNFVLACANNIVASQKHRSDGEVQDGLAYLDLFSTCILAENRTQTPSDRFETSGERCVVLPITARDIREAFTLSKNDSGKL